VDLEAAELYIRSAVFALGATVLERLLAGLGTGRQTPRRQCARGHLPRNLESTGVRAKTLRSILGPVRFARSRYVCPECGAVEYPGDESLGVAGAGCSPGLRRLMARAGSRESFGEAAEDLRVYGAIETDSKEVERVAEATGRLIDDWMRAQGAQARLAAHDCLQSPESAKPAGETIPILYVALDGTGAPMRPSELQNARGKGEDGRAKTREVKLGCVFTQTTTDDDGRPLRDSHRDCLQPPTTYVGAIESSVDFGQRLLAVALHQEALRRGLRRAQQAVVLSDGAEYNATIVREHFPTATHLLDFYHASERLSELVKEHTNHPGQGPFHEACHQLLEAGEIERLLERLHEALPRRGPRRKTGLKRIAYFTARKELMRYGKFRAQGLFVGSGVIEAGCKTLIGKRLKQSGMFWSVAGANAIIAARCCLYSGRFEQFCEDAAS